MRLSRADFLAHLGDLGDVISANFKRKVLSKPADESQLSMQVFHVHGGGAVVHGAEQFFSSQVLEGIEIDGTKIFAQLSGEDQVRPAFFLDSSLLFNSL